MLMLLLQASSGAQMIIPLLLLIFRIIAIVVCVNKAKELNRSSSNWGLFAFFMPLVALIVVHCVKSKVVWDNNVDNS